VDRVAPKTEFRRVAGSDWQRGSRSEEQYVSTALSGTEMDFEVSGSDAARAALALESVGAIPAGPPIAETSLSRAYRLRLSLLGLALALLALMICIAIGLLIAAGPFHTSLGSLA
jgi:hypothetical protein